MTWRGCSECHPERSEGSVLGGFHRGSDGCFAALSMTSGALLRKRALSPLAVARTGHDLLSMTSGALSPKSTYLPDRRLLAMPIISSMVCSVRTEKP
jgi:hypothetical protein